MNVKDITKAAAYSDRHLATLRLDREWVRSFWCDHLNGSELVPFLRDDAFVQVTTDIQRFVYGDEGDVAMGVPTQDATEAEMDGKLGPMTSRRMQTWIDWIDEEDVPVPTTESDDCLLVNGERLPVGGGVQIISLDEEDGRWSLEKHSRAWAKRVATMLGFGHWDVCTSAQKCFAVLLARHLSSGGCFDNPTPDGLSAFYQFLDPGKRRGAHGGTKANRAAFFSFDMSNTTYNRDAEKYLKKVGIARPTIHMDQRERLGRGSVFLGMYAGQIHSLLYILKALADYTGKPLVFPTKPDGTPLGRNFKKLFTSKFDGVATHRHLPRTTKWDIRCLEHQAIVMFLKGRLPMGDFPSLVESFRLHDAHWHRWLEKFESTCRWPELGIGS